MARLVLILVPALLAWGSLANPSIENLESDTFSQESNAETKIFNGTLSEPYPFFIALGGIMDDNPFVWCGASLITPTTVLTAAHCFSGDLLTEIQNASEYNAVVSPTDLYKWYDYQRIPFTLANVTKHENYGTPDTQSNDIAIIKLSQPVKLGKGIAPICVDKKNYTTQRPVVTLVGFGKDTCTSSPTVLKYATGKFLSNSACKKYPKFEPQFRNILPTNVCAELQNKGGSWSIQGRGDSGGPLFRKAGKSSYAQLGLVSYSYKAPTGCAERNSSGLFTSPALFPTFINKYGGKVKWC